MDCCVRWWEMQVRKWITVLEVIRIYIFLPIWEDWTGAKWEWWN